MNIDEGREIGYGSAISFFSGGVGDFRYDAFSAGRFHSLCVEPTESQISLELPDSAFPALDQRRSKPSSQKNNSEGLTHTERLRISLICISARGIMQGSHR